MWVFKNICDATQFSTSLSSFLFSFFQIRSSKNRPTQKLIALPSCYSREATFNFHASMALSSFPKRPFARKDNSDYAWIIDGPNLVPGKSSLKVLIRRQQTVFQICASIPGETVLAQDAACDSSFRWCMGICWIQRGKMGQGCFMWDGGGFGFLLRLCKNKQLEQIGWHRFCFIGKFKRRTL